MMEEGSMTVCTPFPCQLRGWSVPETQRGESHRSLLCRQPADRAYHRQAAPIGASLLNKNLSPGECLLSAQSALRSQHLDRHRCCFDLGFFLSLRSRLHPKSSLISLSSFPTRQECERLLDQTQRQNTKGETGQTWMERKRVRARERERAA